MKRNKMKASSSLQVLWQLFAVVANILTGRQRDGRTNGRTGTKPDDMQATSVSRHIDVDIDVYMYFMYIAYTADAQLDALADL